MSKRSAKSRSHSKKASSGKIRTSRAFDPGQLKPLGALALGIVLISALLNALSLAPAAPDAAAPDIVISEVMTRNSTCLADDSGQYSDWIELCNTSAAPVSLRGWMLMSTSGKTGDAYVFADEVLDPGEYCVIFASGRSSTRPGYVHHAPFRLSSSGASLSLYDAQSGQVAQLDIPALDADAAYARGSDGTYSVTYEPTPGAANVLAGQIHGALSQCPLLISEVMADNATYTLPDGCLCDYVELYNPSAQYVDLNGFHLSDDPTKVDKYSLDGMSVAPGEYLLIHLDGQGGRPYHASFGLNADGETVSLYDNENALVDAVSFELMPADAALSLVNGAMTTFFPPTPGASNTSDSAAWLCRQFDQTHGMGLYINEMIASNTQAVSGGNTYDWIELRNTTQNAVDLSGWGLSDNPKKPRKWQFPEGSVIGSGDYLVVMLAESSSGPDSKGYYYADFSLSSGESLTLCRPDGSIVDRVPVMRQYGDISCGRVEDQDGYFYFTSPTPGSYNGREGYRSRCEKPVFSQSGGLYDGEAVTLTLTAEPDALIFYTLDCTDPSTSSSMYSGPITVSSTTVVRAIATRRGSIDSYIATESYIYGENSSFPVASLVTDPYNLYDSGTGIIANPIKQWERAGNIEIYRPDGSALQISHGCGVALNGDASRRLDMKTFRVVGRLKYDTDNSFTGDLLTNRDYEGYRSFLLRSGGQDQVRALIRDPFIDTMAADTQVMYQESDLCVLYLNGEYYGVYDIRERITTYSVCDFMGWERTKNIDVIKNNDLAQHGSNRDYQDILNWIKDNPTATDENIAYLDTRVDLDNYIDYMCFMIYSANQDVGVRRYRNAAEDGRWRWIVFDQDFGFYNDTNSIARWMDKEGAGSRKTVENQLFRYLMSNEAFRDRYLTRFGELVQGPWSSQNLLTRFDNYIEVLRPEMTRHCERWSEVLKYSRWEKAVTAMRERIAERAGKICGYMADYFSLSDEQIRQYFGDTPIVRE